MQVNAAGDLCAICQEKMDAPILLRCKHIFCEECVSEWLVHTSIPYLELLFLYGKFTIYLRDIYSDTFWKPVDKCFSLVPAINIQEYDILLKEVLKNVLVSANGLHFSCTGKKGIYLLEFFLLVVYNNFEWNNLYTNKYFVLYNF